MEGGQPLPEVKIPEGGSVDINALQNIFATKDSVAKLEKLINDIDQNTKDRDD